MPEAIYTATSCKAAYKLNWSLAVFWNASPPPAVGWLDALGKDTEPDGVRLLEHRLAKGNVSQFLVSTRPETAPSDLARSIK
ncbi:MAG: hypothetical protein ACREHD_22555, partial [Pirellulales bacterium]